MPIDVAEFSALALAHFVALLSPGPDFILIVGSTLQHGYRKTLWACLGIAIANGTYILLAIGGFSLLRENAWIFWGMKLGAAVYLLYLAIQLIKNSQSQVCIKKVEVKIAEVKVGKMFLRGFLSAVLNPKNAIFYLSLMTLIVSQRTPIQIQLIYCVWMFSMVLLWDVLVAWCIGNSWVRGIFGTHIWRLERLSGLLLMLVAILVALK